MAKILSKNNLSGGMDVDSLSQNVAPNNYRYALNLRNGVAYINKKGGATFVKGNVLIPLVYYPYGTLTGNNKTIGSYEDKEFNTIIFMVYNQNGSHSIFRYFPDLISSGNPDGEIHQIAMRDFGWLPNTQITSINHVSGKSGTLLYWCDNIQGRRLNITKSDVVGKFKTWQTYLPKSFPTYNVSFALNINDFTTGASIIAQTISTLGQTSIINPQTFWAYVATQINNNTTSNQYIIAEGLSDRLLITELKANAVATSFFNLICQNVPFNWYGKTITERFVDEAIYPSYLSPLIDFGINSAKAFNNVKNQVWQFQTCYLTNDFEKSLLSPFSQVPINELVNDGLQIQNYNYLNVNFNDVTLLAYLTEIQYMYVVARSGNTGAQQTVSELLISDFLDYNYTTNQWFFDYDFYNDTIANTLDPVFAFQQESGVPINNAAQELVQNRLVKLAPTNGLNPIPDFDITVTQDFENNIDDFVFVQISVTIYSLYTLGGGGTVQSGPPVQTSEALAYNSIQPIVKYAPADVSNPALWESFPQWGGFIPDPQVIDGLQMGDKTHPYDQFLPLGGFLLFSNATDYWGLTQQIQNPVAPSMALPITLGTVLDVNSSNVDNVRKFMFYPDINTPDIPSDPRNFKFTNIVTIKVPRSIHTFRVASHFVSFGDVLNKGVMYNLYNGREYQTTSTNVYATNPYVGGAFSGNNYNLKEITIDLTNAVAGSTIYIGNFTIEDCRPLYPQIFNQFVALSGYLINAPNGTSVNALASAPRMEYQLMNFPPEEANFLAFDTYYLTDHNGYFYFSMGINNGGEGGAITLITTSPLMNSNPQFYNAASNQWTQILNTIYCSSSILNNLQKNTLQTIGVFQFNNTGTIYPAIENQFNSSAVQLLINYEGDSVANTFRTYIDGSMVDSNGNPISNAIVYSTFCGRQDTTDILGKYRLLVYATALNQIQNPPFGYYGLSLFQLIPLLPIATPTKAGNLIELYNSATTNINNNNQSLILTFPPYSLTNPFNAVGFELVANYAPFGKALKRGCPYQPCVRYKDSAGRLTTMNTNDASIFYIPYMTEDLHKYFPNQYPIGTFLSGKPTITIQLNFAPPIEAVSYDICLSKNQYETSYLQWVANQITYVTDIGYSAAETNVLGTTSTTNTIQSGNIVSSTSTTTPTNVYNPPVESSYLQGNATSIYISFTNLVDYKNANPNSILNYVYGVGDRIRLIADPSGGLYTELYELEVSGYDTELNAIIVSNNSNIPQLFAGCLFEVLHPRYKTPTDEQLFYEVGESFPCTNPGQPNNAHSVNPIVLTCGDTYWRQRQYIVNDTTDFIFTSTSYLIEDPNLSDFFASASWDIGRAGVSDPYDVQITEETEIIISDVYQTDSNSNGFCNFPALNFKILDKNYGAGQRLVMIGDVLHVICANRSISDYIGQRVLSESKELNGPVAIADDFLGTNRAQIKEIGTQHPASVRTKDGYLYILDAFRAIVARDANDGLIEISKGEINGITTMQSYFKDLCSNGFFSVTAGIDKYYNEYILTTVQLVTLQTTVVSLNMGVMLISVTSAQLAQIEATTQGYMRFRYYNRISQQWFDGFLQYGVNGGEIGIFCPTLNAVNSGDAIFLYYGGDTDTIKWDENENIWKGHYSFTPECYGQLGDLLYSFNQGQLYVHDQNPVYNNFYGVQYQGAITPVANSNPDLIKAWMSMTLEMVQANGGNNWSASITNDYGQISVLVPQNYKLKERQWSVDFKRDMTDTSVVSPLVNGKIMRSESLTIALTSDYTAEMFLRTIKVLSFVSMESVS